MSKLAGMEWYRLPCGGKGSYWARPEGRQLREIFGRTREVEGGEKGKGKKAANGDNGKTTGGPVLLVSRSAEIFLVVSG